MAESILTSVRHAVWKSINDHPAFGDGFFKKKFTFEDDAGKVGYPPNPSPNDLPAISIMPNGGNSPWVTNQAQLASYPLIITWWTSGWDIRKGEWIWDEINKAVFQRLEKETKGASRIQDRSDLTWEIDVNSTTGGVRAKWSIGLRVAAGYWNPTKQS